MKKIMYIIKKCWFTWFLVIIGSCLINDYSLIIGVLLLIWANNIDTSKIYIKKSELMKEILKNSDSCD